MVGDVEEGYFALRARGRRFESGQVPKKVPVAQLEERLRLPFRLFSRP